jgi:hypothetical protein
MRIIQQSSFQRFILPTIVLFSLLCAWSAADAALVTYSFTGGVTNVSNALKPTLGISPISGTFTFDNSPATGGTYLGVVSGLNVNVGGYTATYASGLVNGVSIAKGVTLLDGTTGDNWKLATSAQGMPVNGYTLQVFDLDLEREGSLFTNTNMQNPPSIGDLTGTRWRMIFENAMGVVRIQGNVLTLTAVPLPAAVLLFGAGLISLVGLGAGGLRNFRGTQA